MSNSPNHQNVTGCSTPSLSSNNLQLGIYALSDPDPSSYPKRKRQRQLLDFVEPFSMQSNKNLSFSPFIDMDQDNIMNQPELNSPSHQRSKSSSADKTVSSKDFYISYKASAEMHATLKNVSIKEGSCLGSSLSDAPSTPDIGSSVYSSSTKLYTDKGHSVIIHSVSPIESTTFGSAGDSVVNNTNENTFICRSRDLSFDLDQPIFNRSYSHSESVFEPPSFQLSVCSSSQVDALASPLMDDFESNLLPIAQASSQSLAGDENQVVRSSPLKNELTGKESTPILNQIKHNDPLSSSSELDQGSSPVCNLIANANFQGFATARGRPLPLPSKELAADLLARLQSYSSLNKGFQTKVVPDLLTNIDDCEPDVAENIINLMSQTSSNVVHTSTQGSTSHSPQFNTGRILNNKKFKPVIPRSCSSEFKNQKLCASPETVKPVRTAAEVKQFQMSIAADLFGSNPFSPYNTSPLTRKHNLGFSGIQQASDTVRASDKDISVLSRSKNIANFENIPPSRPLSGSRLSQGIPKSSFIDHVQQQTTHIPIPQVQSRGFTTPFKTHAVMGTRPVNYQKQSHKSQMLAGSVPGHLRANPALGQNQKKYKQSITNTKSDHNLETNGLITPKKSSVIIDRTPCQGTFRTPFKKISSISNSTSRNHKLLASTTPLERPMACSSVPKRNRKMAPELFNLTWDPQVCRVPRIRLQDLSPQDYIDNSSCISEINSFNAMQYRFPDLGWGAHEAYTALIWCGGNAKLISQRWVRNHYRWIVWKLYCYAQKYGTQTISIPKFTRDSVMRQLQYRYEREIVCGHRSCLQQLLERDEVAARPMVLFVSRIVYSPSNDIKLELSDGWYSVIAMLDSVLTSAVQRTRIRVGMKLAVSMAIMMGNPGGVSAIDVAPDWPSTDPLDTFDPLTWPCVNSEFVYLKINANAVKPAPWDAKLGFLSRHRTLPLALCALSESGGVFSDIAVQILRVYPMVHLEIYPSGEKACRNDWEESRAQQEFDSLVMHGKGSIFGHKGLDYPTVQSSDQVSDDDLINIILFDQWDTVRLRLPLHVVNDLEIRAASMSESTLMTARQKLQRQVVPFIRILVACVRQMYRECDGDPVLPTRALITIWRPDESVRQAIVEGAVFQVTYGKVTGIQNGTLLLSTTSQSRWNPLTLSTSREGPGGRVFSVYQPRNLIHNFTQLVQQASHQKTSDSFETVMSWYWEVDFQGLAVTVNPSSYNTHAPELFVMDSAQNFVLVKVGRKRLTGLSNNFIQSGQCLQFRNFKLQGMEEQWRMPLLHSVDESEWVHVRGQANPSLAAQGRAILEEIKLSSLDWGAFFSQDRHV